MEINTLNSLSIIEESEWQAGAATDYPFLSYGFLLALEESGCVSAESGWIPQHLILKQEGRLVGVMPQYLKSHSWGEYVFDQDWANAFHRYGYHYYPKLLSAIPFTPATGPRWGMHEALSEHHAARFVATALQVIADERASSFHCLFPGEVQASVLEEQHLLKRRGCQFHWFNRGYSSFDDFLAAFASRKRKNCRKERQRVQGLNLTFQRQPGHELNSADWARFYELYASTYYKRGHNPHLNLKCFILWGQYIGEAIIVDWVYEQENPIAAALFFKDSQTLYGRYWGCKKDYDGLHFEVCFYRGIEYAIAQGLKRFDPGAQGEHKIARGFEPVETVSYHWIGHKGFHEAIKKFLKEEQLQVARYHALAAERLPFKRE